MLAVIICLDYAMASLAGDHAKCFLIPGGMRCFPDLFEVFTDKDSQVS